MELGEQICHDFGKWLEPHLAPDIAERIDAKVAGLVDALAFTTTDRPQTESYKKFRAKALADWRPTP